MKFSCVPIRKLDFLLAYIYVTKNLAFTLKIILGPSRLYYTLLARFEPVAPLQEAASSIHLLISTRSKSDSNTRSSRDRPPLGPLPRNVREMGAISTGRDPQDRRTTRPNRFFSPGQLLPKVKVPAYF